MKRKSILLCTFMAVLALLLNSASVQPDPETKLPTSLGVSFRYLRTIGTTGVPYDNGEGNDDYVNDALGIGMDGDGNLYAAEGEGMRVLRYDAFQHADLILGTAGFGATDDTHFSWPYDVLPEVDGDFWVADEYRITRWDSNGVLELTYPANPRFYCDPEVNIFCAPAGLAFDSSGRLYVADGEYHVVQVFTLPDGENPLYWSTIGVFGEAGSDNDHFYVPNHIDIDGDDNLYVADSENHRIQKCTYSGSWSCTTFHGGEEGDGDDQLSIPNAATVNGSTLYIADTGNWRVKSCDLNTMECNSDFIIDIDTPTDVAVNTLGEIFVSQTGSAHIVSRFSSEGTKLDDYAGTYGTPYLTSPDKIFWPNGLAVDRAGNVYVNELRGNRYLKYDKSGNLVGSIGTAGYNGAGFSFFRGRLWGNPGVSADKLLYLSDTNRHCIKIFNTSFVPQNRTIGTCSSPGDSDVLFRTVAGVAVSPLNGNIYVVDTGNHKVKGFTSSLSPLGPLGGLASGYGDGDYQFNHPEFITIDKLGNIYVADSLNHRVQKYDSSGVYQDTFGTTGLCGWENDFLCSPGGVAIDRLNRVYIADTWNHRVQVFDADGTYLTTIGGSVGTSNEELNWPKGVVVAPNGTVYVADQFNQRIQVFTLVVPFVK